MSPASRFVSSTATATMGPNSPMAPTDRMEGPTGVRNTPASCRIGRRVPSAVVVRHSATTVWSSTSPVAWRKTPTPSASTSDATHEPAALSEVALAHGRQVELGSGQEHQIGQPEVRQRRHETVRVRQIEDVGAEDDAEEDLDHDLGDWRRTGATIRRRSVRAPLLSR